VLRTLSNKPFAALALTQFLGAFNDNVFKQLVLLLSISSLAWVAEIGWAASSGQAVAGALFALPFVLFGALTGSLADRFSKARILQVAKVGEIVVMALACAAIFARSYPVLLAVLFLMGLQSALFGPAKYGSIPELLATRDLSRGNALIQMLTFVAIILGVASGGLLFDGFEHALWVPAAACVGLAVLGTISALGLKRLPPGDPGRRLRWNSAAETARHWRATEGDRALILALIASSFFFLLGATLLYVVNQYGVWLGLRGGTISLLQALIAVGIAGGSVLAARLSGDRIESGLVPLGLGGMAAALLAAQVAPRSIAWLAACLFATGVAAGLFSVPIRALIQHRPRKERKGAILGLGEVLDFGGVLCASALFWLLGGALELDPPGMLTALSVLTALFTLGSFFYTAEWAVRLVVLCLTRTIYRIRSSGARHVPQEGGALLVCNHLSYVDPFLVAAACPRPLRFLMYSTYFELPGVGHFARLMGTVPVAAEDSTAQKRASLQRAAELAASGELVCIFAEGAISRSGSLMPFARGLERIAQRAGVPIVPVALDGVWGSVFSFEGGRALWKRPRRFPYPVAVSFGPPLSSDAPAWLVRNRVQELVARSRARGLGPRDTLTDRFLRSAARHARRTALIDTSGARLSYRALLQRALALRAVVARRCAGQERVGLYLPPGAAGVACNLAVSLAGKVAVNLNYSLGPSSLARPIGRSGLRTILTSPRFIEALGTGRPAAPEALVTVEDLAGAVTAADKLRAFVLSHLPGPLLARIVRPVRDPARPLAVLFSSGSTGEPKGVVLTHANVLTNLDAMAQVLRLEPQDRLLGVLPFFHSFGYTATFWTPLLHGCAACYHARPLEAGTVARLIEREHVTVALATPAFYQAWMRRLAPAAVRGLRAAVVGAEKLGRPLREAWRAAFGSELLEGYGCTELAPVVSVNLPEAAGGRDRQPTAREGTVGRPLPGVALRVVDTESGAELPPGAEGQVLVAGPNVMWGYLDDPERTDEVLRGGWYDTGDVGFVDRDGFLVLTDRRSRFSKIGGEMVPHGRVEEVLQELARDLHARSGAAGDAPQLAVTAVADERRSEALVVLHTPLGFARERLFEALRASALPALYRPRPDRAFEVGEIPRLGSGKTDLRALRSAAERLAGARAPCA